MNARTLILMAACCSAAAAATITIDSRQGLFTSVAGAETVAISPHPVWEPNHPINPGDSTDRAAVWISWADTGFGGAQLQTAMAYAPAATIFDTFVSGAGMLTLYVWADDTASVRLDGSLLMPAAFTSGVCSQQAIGCRPPDGGLVTAALSEGSHTLRFDLYQMGPVSNTHSDPFGLLFTGTAPAQAARAFFPADPPDPDSLAPEPSTAVLLAAGAAALVWWRGRRHIRS